MKKILSSAVLFLLSFCASAQSAAVAQEPAAQDNLLGGIISVVVLVVVVAALAHMLYVAIFSRDLRTDYKAQEFSKLRKDKNLGDMNIQEVTALGETLDKMLAQWEKLPNEDGELVPYPIKLRVIKSSIETLDKAVAAMPTNSHLVERINDANEVINHALKRQFNGSKAMVITAIIVGVVITAITGSVMAAISFALGVLLYLLGSRSAMFFIAAKQFKGESNSSPLSALISSLFMGTTSAKVGADNSPSWTTLCLGLVVMILLSAVLPVIAIINYLRNYLIYR